MDLQIHNALVIVCIGLAATSVMTLVLYGAKWSRMIDTDVLSAVGSIFTRSRAKYQRVGWAVHLLAGVGFAFLYFAAMNALTIDKPLFLTLVGGVIGAFHGMIVSFFVAIYLGEHHRLRRMRGSAGFSVAVTQWGAHVIYGMSLGLVAAAYLVIRMPQ